MPRTYKSKTTKPYKKHNPETIQEAIDAINGGLTFRQASARYRIPLGVLSRHKNGPVRKQGLPPVFSEEEEKIIVSHLETCAKWGYPLTPFELRLIIKRYLVKQKRTVKQFKNGNLPGKDFSYSFLKRHRDVLAQRLCENIKRSRAAVSRTTGGSYFANLEEELVGVPACNILNYDETNLSDDPGKKCAIFKRGMKHPVNVVNTSKSSTSVMFAVTGDGVLQAPYVVYKSAHLYDSWTEGAPSGTRCNRSKSGWFDLTCFADWVKTVAIPYFRNKSGKKILLGDNLSSHVDLELIELCKQYDVHFIYLPPNSTHLTQPLDVAFFRPLKILWRKILEEWKQTASGSKAASVPKDVFPRLLKKLIDALKENAEKNIKAGFRKCGIVPFNPEEVLKEIPFVGEESGEQVADLQSSFEEYLREVSFGDQTENTAEKRRKKKLQIPAGRSAPTMLATELSQVDSEDCDSPSSEIEHENQSDDELFRCR